LRADNGDLPDRPAAKQSMATLRVLATPDGA